MMSFFSKFRLPYREDNLFGCLFLLAAVVPLAFDLMAYENFEIIKFSLLLLLVGVGAFIFFKNFFTESNIQLATDRTFIWLLVLFFFWSVLVSLFAEDKNYSLFGFYPRFTNGLLFYLAWTVLFFLLAAISRQKLFILLKVLFFCAGVVAVWGIIQSLGVGYYGGVTLDFFSRASPSFLGNPNFASMFIAVLAPLGFYFFQHTLNFKSKIYYSLSLFFQIFAVVIFASRGSLLALAAAFVCYLALVFSRRLNFRAIIYGSLGLLILFFSVFFFLNFSRPGTVKQTLSLKETNIQSRLDVWQLSFEAFKDRPVIGYGLGNFELVFETRRELSKLKSGYFDDPHNLFIYLAVSGGFVFLFIFLSLVFYPVFKALKHLRTENNDRANFMAAVLSGILGWLIAAFFTPVAVPCYIVLAFLLSALFTGFKTFEIKKVQKFRVLGKGFSLLLIGYALAFIAAEHLFFSSVKTYNAGSFKNSRTLSKLAITLHPFNSLYHEYFIGSSIRSGRPVEEINSLLEDFGKMHSKRSFTYLQLTKLYYLLLYQTQDPKFIQPLLNNLRTAIKLDPTATNNYFSLAQYNYAIGDIEGTLAALKTGLDLDEKNMQAWIFMAKIYQNQGKREEMVKALKQAFKNSDNLNLLNLIRLAEEVDDIRKVPFTVSLSVGALD